MGMEKAEIRLSRTIRSLKFPFVALQIQNENTLHLQTLSKEGHYNSDWEYSERQEIRDVKGLSNIRSYFSIAFV